MEIFELCRPLFGCCPKDFGKRVANDHQKIDTVSISETRPLRREKNLKRVITGAVFLYAPTLVNVNTYVILKTHILSYFNSLHLF